MLNKRNYSGHCIKPISLEDWFLSTNSMRQFWLDTLLTIDSMQLSFVSDCDNDVMRLEPSTCSLEDKLTEFSDQVAKNKSKIVALRLYLHNTIILVWWGPPYNGS